MRKKIYILIFVLFMLMTGYLSFGEWNGLHSLPDTTIELMVIGFDGKAIPTSELNYKITTDIESLWRYFDYKTFKQVNDNFLKLSVKKNSSILCTFKEPKTFEMDLYYRILYEDPKTKKLYIFESKLDANDIKSLKNKKIKLYLNSLVETKLNITLDNEVVENTKVYLENSRVSYYPKDVKDKIEILLKDGKRTLYLQKGYYSVYFEFENKKNQILFTFLKLNVFDKVYVDFNPASKDFIPYRIDISKVPRYISAKVKLESDCIGLFYPVLDTVDLYLLNLIPTYVDVCDKDHMIIESFNMKKLLIFDDRIYCSDFELNNYNPGIGSFYIAPSYMDLNGNQVKGGPVGIFTASFFRKIDDEWKLENFLQLDSYQFVMLTNGQYKVLVKCVSNPLNTVTAEFLGEVNGEYANFTLNKVEN